LLTRVDPRTPALEEDDLIRAAQHGDRPACAALVDLYWDRVFRFLYHLTRNRHVSEDVTQETFLKALSRLQTFQAGTNFRAWLFRIGSNTLLNQRRSLSSQSQPVPEELPDPEDGPEERALERESLQVLARAVGQLSEEHRAAFLLRVEEDLSFRQIADVLGLSEETARWRVFKARQKLVQILAPQLDGETP
jgi:RNA polymerase sigma-70 factor (ECF subfamily)